MEKITTVRTIITPKITPTPIAVLDSLERPVPAVGIDVFWLFVALEGDARFVLKVVDRGGEILGGDTVVEAEGCSSSVQ
jgi:hypothetical protein